MSYSFAITAATKDDAKRLVAEQFDVQVTPTQPIHQRDRAAALAAANAYVDLLVDDPGQHLRVQLNGSVSYQWSEEDPNGNSAPLFASAVGVQAWYVPIGTFELTKSVE